MTVEEYKAQKVNAHRRAMGRPLDAYEIERITQEPLDPSETLELYGFSRAGARTGRDGRRFDTGVKRTASGRRSALAIEIPGAKIAEVIETASPAKLLECMKREGLV